MLIQFCQSVILAVSECQTLVTSCSIGYRNPSASGAWKKLYLRILYWINVCVAEWNRHLTSIPVMVGFVSSIPTEGNFIFTDRVPRMTEGYVYAGTYPPPLHRPRQLPPRGQVWWGDGYRPPHASQGTYPPRPDLTGVPPSYLPPSQGTYPHPAKVPTPPPQNRTAYGVLDTPRSVCLLSSRRRTFLFHKFFTAFFFNFVQKCQICVENENPRLSAKHPYLLPYKTLCVGLNFVTCEQSLKLGCELLCWNDHKILRNLCNLLTTIHTLPSVTIESKTINHYCI